MASRTSNAWDVTADGRSSVASELDAIFAALPRVVPVAEPTPLARSGAPRRRGLRLWLLFLAAVALVALVGSLALLMPIARQAPPRQMPVPHAVRPAAPPPIAPAEPAATVPPTVRSQTLIQPPARATTPVRHAPPAPVRHAAPKPLRRAPAPAHHGRCPRFATEAWCLHGTISAADVQLRDAYNAAVRAGVSRETLVDIRSDWKRLRGRANRDPQALIRGYALLTQELRAETRRHR